MARPEKVQAVADIKERVEGAEAVFITEYAGLKVAQQQELRRTLRAADAEYQVVKMTLARRAVGDLGHDELLDLLVGPTGLAFAPNDPVPAAKALRDFNRANEALIIKGMLMAGRVLPPEQVEILADIAPREVLLAQLAGTIKAPLTALAGVLSALIRNTGYGFQALLDQRIAAGEALPAAEAPASEPEAEAGTEPEAEAEPEPAAEAEPEPAAEAEPEAAAEAEAEPEAKPEAIDSEAAEAEDEPVETPVAEADEESAPKAADETTPEITPEAADGDTGTDDDPADAAEEE